MLVVSPLKLFGPGLSLIMHIIRSFHAK